MAEILRPMGARPLSPNWQGWRWHVTMTASILHRLAGMAIYAGLLILMGWLIALRAGEAAFSAYAGVLASPIGLIVLFLITLALLFHLANGVRHFAWDLGFGFAPKTADATAWGAFAFAAVVNLLFWLLLAMRGSL
ncbi:MAG: succinate dehydrogenase, cytochrome b556 subunit [Caulobacteraceae bacterium]